MEGAPKKPTLRLMIIGELGKTLTLSALSVLCEERGLGRSLSHETLCYQQRYSKSTSKALFPFNYVSVCLQSENYFYEFLYDEDGNALFLLDTYQGFFDGALLVTAVTSRVGYSVKSSLALVRSAGVSSVIVFVNQRKDTPLARRDSIDLSLRKILQKVGFSGDDAPIIWGDASRAISKEAASLEAISDLLKTLDQSFSVKAPAQEESSLLYRQPQLSEHQRLIQTIAQAPSREDYRLTYAEWLEAHGEQSAADYLRTELVLSKLPSDSSELNTLRKELWKAWTSVDPAWLLVFTQPRMLLANPTPFPGGWVNFCLGSLRPSGGTYEEWPYSSLPPLWLDTIQEGFSYLNVKQAKTLREPPQLSKEIQSLLEKKGVRVPEAFVRFLADPALPNNFRSVTGCYFDEEIPKLTESPTLGGVYLPFYYDSQLSLQWELYLHPDGGHCVIARFPGCLEETRPNMRAWFVAPSFEIFLLRMWLENRLWYIERPSYLQGQRRSKPPPSTPMIDAYRMHYIEQQAERR